MQTTAENHPPAPLKWNPWLTFSLLLSYFVLCGVTFGFQGVIWADLITALKLSKSEFGAAQLSAPCVSVILLIQAGPITTRFSKKQVALAGILALTIAIAYMSQARDLWSFVASLALSGVGFGLIEITANATTLDWEAATNHKVMNFMHAGFSGGAIIGSLIGSALLGTGLAYPQILLIAAGLGAIILIATLPNRYPPTQPDHTSVGLGTTLKLLISGPVIIALALICMISTIGESVANTWSVIYLNELGSSEFLSGATFTIFNITMFIGRLANATIVLRFGERTSLILSGICMLVAGVVLISGNIWLAILGFALLGLAVAGVVPTVLSAAARLMPQSSGAITGAIMAVAYTSFIICPPLIGWVADTTSIWFKGSLALQIALTLVALTGAILLALARGIPSTQKPAG